MKKYTGFTIVELLIVIVVIGILAALVLNSFAGAQAKARDAKRKTDVAAIAKAIQVYDIDNGNPASSGCGGVWTGNTGGWFDRDYDGTGPMKSVSQCLTDGKYLPGPITDPINNTGNCNTTGVDDCYRYMKYTCDTGETYVFANLETVAHSSSAIDGAVCASSNDYNYGMNYFVRVD